MLKVDAIEVRYGDLTAATSVSFSVDAGQIVALVGANGAGKSTTLRAIPGLVPLSAGDITLDGISLRSMASHQIVQMGLVHVPEGRHVFGGMTVLENLLLGAYGPAARSGREASLQAMLALFPRLGERLSQAAGTMSGGEQQMLAMARGLMGRPRLLMLDEPTLGLSPKMVDEIFEVVDGLHRQGLSILLVEQNVQRALALADRAYVLETGRVVLAGSGPDVLADPGVRTAYLGL